MKNTKGYFFGFLCGNVAAALIMLALVWLAFSNWLFSPEPAWFSVVTILAGLAPYLLAGILSQLMSKRRAARTWPALLVLMGAAAAACLVIALGEGTILFLLLPSTATVPLMAGSSALNAPLELLAGALPAPVLYHIGWHMAGIKKKPGEG